MRKVKICCFTGHRPGDFGNDYYGRTPEVKVLRSKLFEIVEGLVSDGVKVFVFGGALGVDTWAFQVVDSVKHRHEGKLRTVIVLPHKGYTHDYDDNSKRAFDKMLKRADRVVHSYGGEYNDLCLFKRNEYMVNHSDIVVAVYNGKGKGGTFSCMNYAKKNKKGLIIVDSNNLTLTYDGIDGESFEAVMNSAVQAIKEEKEANKK